MPEIQDFQLNANDEEDSSHLNHSNENTDVTDNEQNDSENNLSQVFSPPVRTQQSFANSTIPSYFQLVDPMLYKTLNDNQNSYLRQKLPNNSQMNECKANSERQHSGEKSVTQEEQQYILNVAHLHFPGTFNLVGLPETWKFGIYIYSSVYSISE